MANDVAMHRYRISVPDDDEATVAWFANQHNPSVSVRLLIKQYIEQNGIGDFFSSSVDGAKKVVPFSAETKKVEPKPESSSAKFDVMAVIDTSSDKEEPSITSENVMDAMPSISTSKEDRNLTLDALAAMVDG